MCTLLRVGELFELQPTKISKERHTTTSQPVDQPDSLYNLWIRRRGISLFSRNHRNRRRYSARDFVIAHTVMVLCINLLRAFFNGNLFLRHDQSRFWNR